MESIPLSTLCTDRGVTITATLVSRPPDRRATGAGWKRSAYHFSIVLRYQGRSMVTEFWSGHGNEAFFGERVREGDRSIWAEEKRARAVPPKVSAADVLSSLILDSTAVDMSFEEWCSEYGSDTDSRAALDTYLQCQRLGRQVRELLGSDFDTFRDAVH